MSLSLAEPHLSKKKRNSSRTLIANGFSKNREPQLVVIIRIFFDNNYKDCFYDFLSMECDNAHGTIPKAIEIERMESQLSCHANRFI
jgi:hypothetical protein